MVRTTQLFIVHYLLRRDRVHMEKVVVSLGGSVLVPGDDDARYLRDLAARIVHAPSVAGVYPTDPRKDPTARLLGRITFQELIDLAGKGHAAAGPSIVFDPMAARVVARDRTPLSVVAGRDLKALRSAILGNPFRG